MGLPDPRVDLPRAERLRRALDRDGGACAWCRRALTPDSASVDHLVPRLKGGPAWPENEVAACRPCNRARGHTAPAEWLADCEGRGLEPDRALVVSRLAELQAAIEARGIAVQSAESEFVAQNLLSLDEDKAKEVLELVDALEQDEDVQRVFHNLG